MLCFEKTIKNKHRQFAPEIFFAGLNGIYKGH